jgi:hypothetical protein
MSDDEEYEYDYGSDADYDYGSDQGGDDQNEGNDELIEIENSFYGKAVYIFLGDFITDSIGF